MSRPRNPALYYGGNTNYRIPNPERRGKPTLRKDLDPIFFELAARAAALGMRDGHTGWENVNFGRPTTNPHGYYMTLKWLSKHPNCTFREIKNAMFNGRTPIATMDRLGAGGFVTRHRNLKRKYKCYEYEVTDFGKCYLEAIRLNPQYLGTRKSRSYWSHA